jgi:hypothetical protein
VDPQLLNCPFENQSRTTAKKFAAGTRLALGQTLFPRDEDIYERLHALFTLRNRLVHARPREVEAEEVLGEQSYKGFNPLAAYEHLEVVAHAAKRLLEAHDPPASALAPEQLLDGLPLLRPIAEQSNGRSHSDARADAGRARRSACGAPAVLPRSRGSAGTACLTTEPFQPRRGVSEWLK